MDAEGHESKRCTLFLATDSGVYLRAQDVLTQYVLLTSYAMFIPAFRPSKNPQPADTSDYVSDRHPSCSRCQRGAAKERADGNPEEEVTSQRSSGLSGSSPLVPCPHLLASTLVHSASGWSSWRMRHNPARQSLKRSAAPGQYLRRT